MITIKELVTAFFKAVNSVIALFGGEKIDVDQQVDDIMKWFGEAGFDVE